ncbi:MAG: hypothetical protein ACLRQZ_07025 [Clostridia bacterium]
MKRVFIINNRNKRQEEVIKTLCNLTEKRALKELEAEKMLEKGKSR